jgi:acetylornithine deacetylase/succinyl-diaminopimelate desuccinylase-like protein
MTASAYPTLAEDVLALAQDLIRIDTTNTGETASSAGERDAAEYVVAALAEVGVGAAIYESEPRRASVVARIPGADPMRPALLIDGHLDVVAAFPEEWSVDPFAGEVTNGYLWGRGAVDMKNMVAMVLAVVRSWQWAGRVPPRDLVLAFLADEEAGGSLGSHWLVENHPELFADCTEAVSEVGGFSLTLGDERRLYLIQTAEKGIAWMRLRARGKPGHGSMLQDDNAVTRLSQAVARLGEHRFPVVLTATVRAFLEEVSDVLGVTFDPDDPEAVVAHLGPAAKLIGATLRNTANPTMLSAGHKANVVPGLAEAVIDGRVLPGQEEAFLVELDGLLGPGIEREVLIQQPPWETSFDGSLVAAMAEALRLKDPAARPVPYMLSGGTDQKAFGRMGIRGLGFCPLRLPPDLDFASLFHGVDERVPVDALTFGVEVLDEFLARC